MADLTPEDIPRLAERASEYDQGTGRRRAGRACRPLAVEGADHHVLGHREAAEALAEL